MSCPLWCHIFSHLRPHPIFIVWLFCQNYIFYPSVPACPNTHPGSIDVLDVCCFSVEVFVYRLREQSNPLIEQSVANESNYMYCRTINYCTFSILCAWLVCVVVLTCMLKFHRQCDLIWGPSIEFLWLIYSYQTFYNTILCTLILIQ